MFMNDKKNLNPNNHIINQTSKNLTQPKNHNIVEEEIHEQVL